MAKVMKTSRPMTVAELQDPRGRARWVAAGFVFGVDGDQGDTVPGAKGRGDDAADEADHVDMSVLFGNVDAGLQHQGREGNAGDPGDEADDGEDGEEEENDAAGVVFAVEHVDGRCEAEDDVEDAGDPDELLGELQSH